MGVGWGAAPRWLSNKESQVPWVGKIMEKEIAILSSILAWEIPYTEEPGGLQSMGLQKVRHDWCAQQEKLVVILATVRVNP